jgi:hypothetical protein
MKKLLPPPRMKSLQYQQLALTHAESPSNALPFLLIFLLNFMPTARYLFQKLVLFHIFQYLEEDRSPSILKAIEELVRLGSRGQRVQNPGRQKPVA